jgi:hypothetical protein
LFGSKAQCFSEPGVEDRARELSGMAVGIADNGFREDLYDDEGRARVGLMW